MASIESSTPTVSHVEAITPTVFDYAWGIRGHDSRVARYGKESGSLKDIDPAAPYAELWIGTHAKVKCGFLVESFILVVNQSLRPSIPGPVIAEQWVDVA